MLSFVADTFKSKRKVPHFLNTFHLKHCPPKITEFQINVMGAKGYCLLLRSYHKIKKKKSV
jgi:hypothetical protein